MSITVKDCEGSTFEDCIAIPSAEQLADMTALKAYEAGKRVGAWEQRQKIRRLAEKFMTDGDDYLHAAGEQLNALLDESI